MKVATLFLASVVLFAQGNYIPPVCQVVNCYTASTGSVSLSGAGLAATIQQPASGPYQTIFGVKAAVQCSVACTVTRLQGGASAKATSTAAQSSIVQSPSQPNGAATPLMLFFAPSNASGGTTVDVTNVQAGIPQIFDLSDVVMGATANQNYTLSVGAITGTAIITFYVGLR